MRNSLSYLSSVVASNRKTIYDAYATECWDNADELSLAHLVLHRLILTIDRWEKVHSACCSMRRVGSIYDILEWRTSLKLQLEF